MSTPPSQRVAHTVRSEMTRHGITQMDVAKALGTSQAAVSRRLSGRVALDVAELHILAALMGVTPASLLDPTLAA